MTLKAEIFEQADILQNLLAGQKDKVETIASEIRHIAPAYVFLAARGTSDNAGRYANYLWGSMNRLPVALATPSLFTFYEKPPLLKGALVLGVSQSGQSPDIVSVLQEGHKQGCATLAITNAPDSPLAKAADFVLDIQAGEEKAVAATKTYTAELMAIAMLGLFVSWGWIDAAHYHYSDSLTKLRNGATFDAVLEARQAGVSESRPRQKPFRVWCPSFQLV